MQAAFGIVVLVVFFVLPLFLFVVGMRRAIRARRSDAKTRLLADMVVLGPVDGALMSLVLVDGRPEYEVGRTDMAPDTGQGYILPTELKD